MSLEKVAAVIGDKEYVFTVETLHAEEDAIIYRAVPDNEPDSEIEQVLPGYVEFDENGVVQADEELQSEKAREITDGIWRAIKEQVVNHHPSFNRPL